MTTEREMDERTGDIEKRESFGYSMISIRKDIRDRMDSLNLKTPSGARMPYGKIIDFLIERFNGNLQEPPEEHHSRCTTEWKVSKDRKIVFRYDYCGICGHIFSEEKKEVSPDMYGLEDSRTIEYLTTPIRVQ